MNFNFPLIWRGPVFWSVILLGIFLTSAIGLAQDTTWTVHALPFDQGTLNGLSFVNADTGWAVGRDQGAGASVIIHTTNGGDPWVLQTHPLQGILNGIFFIDADTGYAVGQANGAWIAILKTTDGGANWQTQSIPQIHGFLDEVFFIDGLQGWAVGWSQNANETLILRSENGADWTQVAHPSRSGILYSVYFTDPDHGWTVGADDFGVGAPMIFHTADGGTNWQEQSHGLAKGGFLDVWFTDLDTGWVGGGTDTSSVLLRTEDGGDTWSVINISASPGKAGQETMLKMGLNYESTSPGKYTSVWMLDPYIGYFVENVQNNGSPVATIFQTYDGWKTLHQAVDSLSGTYVSELRRPRLEEITPGSVIQIPAVGSRNNWNFPFAGTASVHVNPPELTRIDVTPPEVTLNVNDQQQFKAVGYDRYGNVVPFTPIWNATGGTITTGGLYTVTASVQGRTVTGTASVHVKPPTHVVINSGNPKEFQLSQNFPNPFNPETTIRFSVKERCHVFLKVYNLHGKIVSVLEDAEYGPGVYKIEFNAQSLSSGLYLYFIQMKDFIAVKKMVVLE